MLLTYDLCSSLLHRDIDPDVLEMLKRPGIQKTFKRKIARMHEQ